MKVGLFSGVHYCYATPPLTKEDAQTRADKLKATMKAFVKEKVDICFCLGSLVEQKHQDRTQVLACFEEALEIIRQFDIPFYYAVSPQDLLRTDATDLQNLVELYQMQYTVHTDDMLFTILDANYTADMKLYRNGDTPPGGFYLPRSNLESLAKRLEIYKKNVVICYHNLDGAVPSQFVLKNAEEVRGVIRDAAYEKIVIQAAYPHETDRIVEGIRYITVPAMCKNSTDFYKIIEV